MAPRRPLGSLDGVLCSHAASGTFSARFFSTLYHHFIFPMGSIVLFPPSWVHVLPCMLKSLLTSRRWLSRSIFHHLVPFCLSRCYLCCPTPNDLRLRYSPIFVSGPLAERSLLTGWLRPGVADQLRPPESRQRLPRALSANYLRLGIWLSLHHYGIGNASTPLTTTHALGASASGD